MFDIFARRGSISCMNNISERIDQQKWFYVSAYSGVCDFWLEENHVYTIKDCKHD